MFHLIWNFCVKISNAERKELNHFIDKSPNEMRMWITLIASLLITLGYAQTVNYVPLSEIQTDYIELLGTQKGLFSTKITIQLDYGQTQKYDDVIVRDENGKKVVFQSMMHVLNYMNGHGYEYLDSYAVTISKGERLSLHYS